VFPRFVTLEDQRDIERWIIDNFAWKQRKYGPLPPCEQYPHDAPIPAWAEALGRRMVAMGIFDRFPDHVLLRRYDRGVGARPHIDRQAYGPIVAGLTLTSSRTFRLTRPGSRSRLEALLLPGDLYVMTGAARYRWQHSIPAVLDDEFAGLTVPRTDGFSVTWRYAPGTDQVRRSWWTWLVNGNRAKPYLHLKDFLPGQTAQRILAEILTREGDFCPMTGDRNFLRLPKPLGMLPGFSERLSSILPTVERTFQIDVGKPEIEFYVHAYNDGTNFGRHSDDHGGGNWRRRISCVYYVHCQPRRFDGGDLVVYDRRGRAHRVRTEHNSAIFFPSSLVHEVQPVTCRSRAFADSRFSINVWIM
jgi:alkylated DNA repair dioxygenase AlkB